MRVAIIGFGEIGRATADALLARHDNGIEKLIICDVDDKKIDQYRPKDWTIERFHVESGPLLPHLPVADAYIISVWDSTQVNHILKALSVKLTNTKGSGDNLKIISIETTTEPGKVEIPDSLKPYTVFFPHRFNPNDDEHGVFNITRVMGSDSGEALARGMNFFWPFMRDEGTFIQPAPARVAQMTKLVENAYRYMEIVLAQELSKFIEERFPGDWERIREAANTKWNIDIREARDGVGGKCLPKDMDLLIKALNLYKPLHVPDLKNIFSFMQEKNEQYKGSP